MDHILYVIGAGSGAPGRLTPEARAAIASCRFAAAGRGLLRLAADGARTFAIGADLEAVASFVADGLKQADVAVITSGDPGCFSILPHLRLRFSDQIRVIPGISSAQALAARLALPWEDWRLISLHGRAMPAVLGLPPEPALFFCDPVNTPQAAAARLGGTAAGRPAVVGVNLGQADERLWHGSVREAAAMDFSGVALFLVLPAPAPAAAHAATPEELEPAAPEAGTEAAASSEPAPEVPAAEAAGRTAHSKPPASETAAGSAAPAPPPPAGRSTPIPKPFSSSFADHATPAHAPEFQAVAPGIPDGFWLRAEGIPMAKSEFRAVLMAKTQPALRSVIWDVGSGTGTYAVECALLSPKARVFAIDGNPAACALTGENAARFGVSVETVCAEAPGCFNGLPRPDLIIIGGNNGALAEIFAEAVKSLNPGGRVAVTAVLESTKEAAHRLMAASGLANRHATRVAIAHGEAHEWMENNPVILFTGDKNPEPD